MRLLLFVLVLLLAAPSAFAQKSAPKSDSPFVGTWEYVVRPDDPVASATFTLHMDDDGTLDGTFQTNEARKILDIVAEGDHIAFAFDQPGMGRIAIEGTVADGQFSGTAQPEGQDALPMTATLQSHSE